MRHALQLLLAVSVAWPCSAMEYILDSSGNGCAQLGGIWDGATGICELRAETSLTANDSLHIRAGARLDNWSLLANAGSIVVDGELWTWPYGARLANDGTIIVSGLLRSQFVAHHSPIVDNAGTMLCLAGGTLQLYGSVGNETLGFIENHGNFASGGLVNAGLVRNLAEAYSQSATWNFGTIENDGRFTNDGEIYNDTGQFLNGCLGVVDGTGYVYGNPVVQTEPDGDGDQICDRLDCDPSAPTVWLLPAAVTNLRLDHGQGVTELEWEIEHPGGQTWSSGIVLAHAADFSVSPECVDDDAGTSAVHDLDPLPGETFYFLVYVENACGAGPTGNASDGTPRPTAGCL